MDDSIAATSLLYSGEKTDLTGLQYLRARYYNAATGRFNRLDPFMGTRMPRCEFPQISVRARRSCDGRGPKRDVGNVSSVLAGAAIGATIGGAVGGYFGGAQGAAFGIVGGAFVGGTLGYGLAIPGGLSGLQGIWALGAKTFLYGGGTLGSGGIYWSAVNDWDIKPPRRPLRIVFVCGDLGWDHVVSHMIMGLSGYRIKALGGSIGKGRAPRLVPDQPNRRKIH